MRHTCFPVGERYMTSQFILDEFDLDLSSGVSSSSSLFPPLSTASWSLVKAYGSERGTCEMVMGGEFAPESTSYAEPSIVDPAEDELAQHPALLL
jgi:hypothetical protein